MHPLTRTIPTTAIRADSPRGIAAAIAVLGVRLALPRGKNHFRASRLAASELNFGAPPTSVMALVIAVRDSADHGAADLRHLRFEGWRAVFGDIGHHGRLARRQFSRNLFNESGVGSLADKVGRLAENCAARSADRRGKRAAEQPRQRADQRADRRALVAFLRDLLHRQRSARLPYNDGRTEELDPFPSVHVPQGAHRLRDLLLAGKDN